MPPRVIGQSTVIPGAVDVEDGLGNVFQTTPQEAAGIFGADAVFGAIAGAEPEPELSQVVAPSPAELAAQQQLGGAGASAPLALGGGVLGGQSPRESAAQAAQAVQERPPQFQGQPRPVLDVITGQQTPDVREQTEERGVPQPDQLPQADLQGRTAPPPSAAGPAGPIDRATRIFLKEQARDKALGLTGGGGGGPRVRQTITATQEKFNQLPPEQQQVVEGAVEAASTASDELAEAQQRELFAQSSENIQQEGVLKGLNDRLEGIESARVDEREKRREQAVQAMDRFRNDSLAVAEGKIDPDRHFKERGTGARIGAAIAVALGGFAAALTGGRNTALDIINKTINDDIDAQKSDLANKRAGLADQRNVVRDRVAAVGDVDQAASEQKAVAFELAQNEVRKIAAGAQSEQVLARAEAMIASLEVQKNQALAQAVQQAAGTVKVETVTQRRSGGGGGGSRARARKRLQQLTDQELAFARKGREDGFKIPGLTFVEEVGLQNEEKRALRKEFTTFRKFKSQIATVKKLLKEVGSGRLTGGKLSAARARLNATASLLRLTIQKEFTGKQVNESEMAIIEELAVADAGTIRGLLTEGARIDQLDQNVTNQFAVVAEAAGARLSGRLPASARRIGRAE